MADRVRVVRLIEVEYPSLRDYEEDQKNWFIPANGTKVIGKGTQARTYRSATTLATVLFVRHKPKKRTQPAKEAEK